MSFASLSRTQEALEGGLTVTVGADAADGDEALLAGRGPSPLSYHPAWAGVLARSLGQRPVVLRALRDGETAGLLSLAEVTGPLFGRTLSSLPYLNYGGVLAEDAGAARALIDTALRIGKERKCRLLLRHDRATGHEGLVRHPTEKVNVRRLLPDTVDALWNGLSSSVRSQVRKGRKNGLSVHWGGVELLPEFFDVYATNMRDLGTPPYGPALFREILAAFPGRAEICVVRLESRALAAGLLTHGWGVTEVPTAGSLRPFNVTCANMLMYWHLLERSVERGQSAFDFGRCTVGNTVFRFKQQWGGEPSPAEWQADADGAPAGRRPHARGSGRGRLASAWSRLPVPVSSRLGPFITRRVP